MKPTTFLLGVAACACAASATAASFLPTFTTAPAQMKTSAPGWSYTPLFTVGETLPNGYQPVGILDGIGAYELNATTIRAFVNHELGGTSGQPYALANGTMMTGARISYFDIDKKTKGIVSAGLAYNRVIDRAGNVVTGQGQIGTGFDRFCSSVLVEANSFGPGRGFADRIYLNGEETSNGTAHALDPKTGTLYAVPWLGRAAFENVALIDTGIPNRVAIAIGDDTSGAPLYLYVGEKQADGDFLARNGLVGGKLYAWKSNGGDADPRTFGGSHGDSRGGTWVELTVQDAAKAGTAGYDAQGFADQATLTAEARAKGAFSFSRPEDVAVNPENGARFALASTGRDSFADGADTWGTVYTFDVGFDAAGNPVSGGATIVYNGNTDPAHALRSPDNLTWTDAATLLVQEDRSADWASVIGANGNDSSIIEVGLDGSIRTIASIDRSAVPSGQIDTAPLDFGNWENSGIVDISALFGLSPGRYFLGDVQAHSLKLGGMVEGGQLFLLQSNVPEPATWAMLIAGFGAVGVAARRRRTVRTAA